MNAEQVVRKYFEAMNAHDVNKLATTMTDDYVESGYLPNLPPSNKQQSIENNTGFFQAFPDINFQIESMAVQGGSGDRQHARFRNPQGHTPGSTSGSGYR